MGNALKDIEKIEARLWEAADQLRANSKLTSSEYCMPVLGVIFLRHASNRYAAALAQIEADRAAGRFPNRPLNKDDFTRRRALMLPEAARFDSLINLPNNTHLGAKLVEAMNAIEAGFAPLKDQLPKDYGQFEDDLLEDLLRIFNSEVLRSASGDVFGRIYEYFLMKFAIQGAQDNGEFFIPPSITQSIVHIIEPDHGIVLDPVCRSGGMFVQTSHFLEDAGKDTMKAVTFFGQEKTGTTIRLANMNLAVHGLEGRILEANTFYQDEHNLYEGCDFVLAAPPFNSGNVDAERVKNDCRLPFGLPGTTKGKTTGKKQGDEAKKNKETVSNGNYLWISYFYSYLKPTGRAGFVMSSQASSAGHGEALVRRKLVESGAVDAMIAIRSNFFYTRTVPCELWFLDRGKPKERQDTVLMIDARNVYRKVTRKIYDFSPQQLKNLTAIVWLYRGQQSRFLGLVRGYFDEICAEAAAIPAALETYQQSYQETHAQLAGFAESLGKLEPPATSLSEVLDELVGLEAAYQTDRAALLKGLGIFRQDCTTLPPTINLTQYAAREQFAPLAEAIKGLGKQVDLLYKRTAFAVQKANELANLPLPEGEGWGEGALDRRALSKRLKQLDEDRKAAEEQLKAAVYFHRQIVWLQDRFPDAELRPVPGLCKVVSRADIEAADWSLTPGRYVGVAPPEVDEDFDFEQAMRDIHVELADLNREAAELAAKIQQNFEALI